MAFSRDQVSNSNTQTSLGGTSATTTVQFNTLPAASAFIVVGVWNDTSDIPTVTDSSGNAYQRVVSATSNLTSAHMFYTNYKLRLPGSAPLTITATSPNGDLLFWGMQASSYTNSTPGTITPDAKSINTITGTGTLFAYSTGTPQQSGELMLSSMSQGAFANNEGVGLNTTPPNSPFAIVNLAVNSGQLYQVGGFADLLTSDQTQKRIFWNWSANDTEQFASVLVGFLVQPFSLDVVDVVSQAVNRAGVM